MKKKVCKVQYSRVYLACSKSLNSCSLIFPWELNQKFYILLMEMMWSYQAFSLTVPLNYSLNKSIGYVFPDSYFYVSPYGSFYSLFCSVILQYLWLEKIDKSHFCYLFILSLNFAFFLFFIKAMSMESL